MKKYLEIARFTKPQGLKGELRAQIFCDFPEILENFEQFYIGENKTPIEIILRGVRKGFVIIKIDDINTIEEAEVFVGEILYINRDDYPLQNGSYFIQDLIGLEVIDVDTGEVYGKVEEILQNAPKDVYVITRVIGTAEGGDERRSTLMFPSIPEVLIEVNIKAGFIKIRPLEGLFE